MPPLLTNNRTTWAIEDEDGWLRADRAAHQISIDCRCPPLLSCQQATDFARWLAARAKEIESSSPCVLGTTTVESKWPVLLDCLSESADRHDRKARSKRKQKR